MAKDSSVDPIKIWFFIVAAVDVVAIAAFFYILFEKGIV